MLIRYTDLYKTTIRNQKKQLLRLLQLRHRSHANPYHNQGLCICHYQKPLGYQSSSLSLTKASAKTPATPTTCLRKTTCGNSVVKLKRKQQNKTNKNKSPGCLISQKFFSCLDLKISFSLAEYWLRNKIHQSHGSIHTEYPMMPQKHTLMTPFPWIFLLFPPHCDS